MDPVVQAGKSKTDGLFRQRPVKESGEWTMVAAEIQTMCDESLHPKNPGIHLCTCMELQMKRRRRSEPWSGGHRRMRFSSGARLIYLMHEQIIRPLNYRCQCAGEIYQENVQTQRLIRKQIGQKKLKSRTKDGDLYGSLSTNTHGSYYDEAFSEM